MKFTLTLFTALCALGLGMQNSHAQQWSFAHFAATNTMQTKAFAVAFTNGASAQYFFRYAVANNGAISGSGVRYDIAAASASASPVNGTPVTIVTRDSRLGNPIRAVRDFSVTMLYCPFSLRFSDGAMIKGVMERNMNFSAYSRMDGTMVYRGAVGSTLSLSNPY